MSVAATIAPHHRRLWRVAQGLGVVSTVVLVVALFVWPGPALLILWNVLIPVLPATFLVAPSLWRSACPLATLNMATNRWGSNRSLPTAWMPRASWIGLGLLATLVPARRFLFNESGVVLGVVIIAVALLALGLGLVFTQKSGFCNAICPVLPVEKLYGQAPLVQMANPRCDSCTRCVPKGCMDLVPNKAFRQQVGSKQHPLAWLKTPYGVFAAAFPGFVLGYFMLDDVPLAMAGSVYATIALASFLSYLVTLSFAAVTRLASDRVILLLGAAAVGCYYWFAAPQAIAALGGATLLGEAVRLALFALIAWWLVHGWRTLRVRPTQQHAAVAIELPVLERTP